MLELPMTLPSGGAGISFMQFMACINIIGNTKD
jgi:hypothetical protein